MRRKPDRVCCAAMLHWTNGSGWMGRIGSSISRTFHLPISTQRAVFRTGRHIRDLCGDTCSACVGSGPHHVSVISPVLLMPWSRARQSQTTTTGIIANAAACDKMKLGRGDWGEEASVLRRKVSELVAPLLSLPCPACNIILSCRVGWIFDRGNCGCGCGL